MNYLIHRTKYSPRDSQPIKTSDDSSIPIDLGEDDSMLGSSDGHDPS